MQRRRDRNDERQHRRDVEYTSEVLGPSIYEYTATDSTPGGTSAASSPLYVMLSPTISGAMVNSNDSVTLTGIAANGSMGNSLGWRVERTWNHDREQHRRLELHDGGFARWPYAFTATDRRRRGRAWRRARST